MKAFFTIRTLFVSAITLFFLLGGYLGYLSALVDLDEQTLLQELERLQDKAALRHELERARSIVDARKRAYQARNKVFLAQKQEETLLLTEKKERLEKQENPSASDSLAEIALEQEALAQKYEEVQQSLGEQEADLQFFEDQVAIVERLIEEPDTALVQLSPKNEQRRLVTRQLREFRRSRTRVSNRLRQLIDKRNQLTVQRQQKLSESEFWSKQVRNLPDGILISVYDKTGARRTLDPIHAAKIATVLSIAPADFEGSVTRVHLVYEDKNMSRGAAGKNIILMKADMKNQEDFAPVFIHEALGHAYDLRQEVTTGPKSNFFDGSLRLAQNDPSVEYYELSWSSNYDRVRDNNAFASGYGTTNPFEDRAEFVTAYVLQGNSLRSWMQSNAIIAQKYAFIRDEMFKGREFPSRLVHFGRSFDATKMGGVDYTYSFGL